MSNYSNSLFVASVNGRRVTAWGVSATPCRDEPIDPKSTLQRGQGGTAVRIDRINPGRRVTLSIDAGTSDSAYLQGLMNSGATITFTKQQIGTLEVATGTEGVIVNDGASDRGGATSVSDDIYIIEFNTWNSMKGGE
jgi:hypothetical protein